MKVKKRMNSSGQIWIETVLYTLIALSLIGLVLAFVSPKIQEIQDKAIVERTVELFSNLNNVISSTAEVAGNKRIVEIGLKKGSLTINGTADTITFQMETNYQYSQPGEEYNISDNLVAITEDQGSTNLVKIKGIYGKYNLTYGGSDSSKTLTQSSTPYKLSIENKGSNTKQIIDFS